MSDTLIEELNSAFVAPTKSFKGDELAPYTEGSRLLFMQVRGDDDSPTYFIWAFIFLHIQIAKNKKAAIRLAWNKDEFREKLMDWVVGKTDSDRDLATDLVTSIIDEANKGQVEAVVPIGASPGN